MALASGGGGSSPRATGSHVEPLRGERRRRTPGRITIPPLRSLPPCGAVITILGWVNHFDEGRRRDRAGGTGFRAEIAIPSGSALRHAIGARRPLRCRRAGSLVEQRQAPGLRLTTPWPVAALGPQGKAGTGQTTRATSVNIRTRSPSEHPDFEHDFPRVVHNLVVGIVCLRMRLTIRRVLGVDRVGLVNATRHDGRSASGAVMGPPRESMSREQHARDDTAIRTLEKDLARARRLPRPLRASSRCGSPRRGRQRGWRRRKKAREGVPPARAWRGSDISTSPSATRRKCARRSIAFTLYCCTPQSALLSRSSSWRFSATKTASSAAIGSQ